jgi:DNA polymerase-1
MSKKLFLLDALALIFRAFHALNSSGFTFKSKGRNTNAQFGFTNTLVDLITNQKPSHLAVCFDTAAPTERHSDFTAYKANRQESPEDLMAALPDIKRIIKAFNIPVIEVDGYEADDVIGTLSKQAEKNGYDVFMVTPDKDFGQLVTEKIRIYKPPYKGGIAEILGPKEVCEKWNISDVNQVIDILGLMGDTVDNIPGIPGVGEKTAAKLLSEFKTLENILDNAGNIKGSLGEKVRNGRESAILSKKLATIVTNVPVEFNEERFRLKELNKEALREVFLEFEFRTLGKRVFGEEIGIPAHAQRAGIEKLIPEGVQTDLFGNPVESVASQSLSGDQPTNGTPVIFADKNITNTPHRYEIIEGEERLKSFAAMLGRQKEICFDIETTCVDANNCELVGISFSFKMGEAYYVPFPGDQETTRSMLCHFEPLFNDSGITWIGYNLKYDLLVLKWYNYELAGELFDTMVAHYVIDPEGKRNIDDLSERFLGYKPVATEELIGKKGKGQINMKDVELEKVSEYASEGVDITLQLKQVLSPMLQTKNATGIFYEVDNPLVKVLAEMEFEGIRIDTGFLKEYSKELDKEAKRAEESVYQQAGVRFNLSSPRQLGEVLFDKLKLDPKAKKTKSGQYATGEDVLLKLSHQNKIVDEILIYRELTKLKSTYVDALPEMINPKSGRVHTSYLQAQVVTGRLSSNNPNLQNIPVRTERGREIRRAFIPRDEDHVLLSVDYSQIELRIVAAISGDPAMSEAFRSNTDIHTATAAKIYNVDEAAVTKEQRYKAKSVNFGIIYGQGAFGLAANLGISRNEAKEIIDNYKKQFTCIQQYMDNMIHFAQVNGYVQTLVGRKRWLKDINSANFTIRGFAERNAINSPIQGTAADMIKLAMSKIHKTFKKQGFKSKMVLQVHDELVFDALREEAEEIKPIIIDCMRTALPLPNGVPVEAEIGEGDNWLEAH